MDREQVISRLVELMEDAFDEDDIAYSDDLTADDIEEWDSLSNVRFIVSVEQAFGVRFTVGEIEGFANVGELVAKILEKLG
ncbi:acyl carrier protein [Sphingobium xanthum]|uniref:acyl carrier protein n=1 Tax=Sphingobium xanthum TaxID=1387165 RepID=UPI001FE274BE|nr:acyl carrier protein [Sphingobium xanthum]